MIVLNDVLKGKHSVAIGGTHSSGWGLRWFYNWIISLSDHLLSGD